MLFCAPLTVATATSTTEGPGDLPDDQHRPVQLQGREGHGKGQDECHGKADGAGEQAP